MLQRRILVLLGLLLFLLLAFNTTAFAKAYTVKKGENLLTISKKLGVSVDVIKKENHLTSNNLKAGQVLQISSAKQAVSASSVDKTAKSTSKTTVSDKTAKSKSQPIASLTYKIKKGDTLATISQKTGVPVKHIIALNNIHSRNLHIGHNLVISKSSPAVIPATVDLADDDMEEDDDEEELASTNPPSDPLADLKTNEELLGKWGSADERKLFIKVATGFLGAPYRLGGATVRGIDCSAFVRKMYELFDIALPRTASEQSCVGIKVDKDKLVEGDLVFFRTRKPIGHVGIYIGNNKFLHASYKGKSVRIDSLDQPYFQKRFRHAVRVKALDENSGT